MGNHEHRCRGCGNDLRRESGNHEGNCLASRLNSCVAENGQLRELLNSYNLGGWMDSERLIKERDEAKHVLGFFMSAVRCGEPWTDRCDEMRAKVFPVERGVPK